MPPPSMSGNSRGEYQRLGEEADEEAGADVEFDDSHERFLRHRRKKLLLAIFLTLVMAAAFIALLIYASQENGPAPTPSPHSDIPVFKHAAVAADASQCSKVGADILKSGGNAVDAAIASLLCDGLANTHSMGLGGGFFMTIYNRSSGVSTTIDSREMAPGKASEYMYHNYSEALYGPLSIAVPGEVKGYEYVHKKYGQLPWKTLFQPAINMATDGFPVPVSLARAIKEKEDVLLNEPSLRAVFFNNKTGELYKEGELLKRPQLAKTLTVLSEEGAAAFYNGSLTDDLIQDLNDVGSIITRQDLLDFKVVERKPLEITLKEGFRVLSPPLPSGGAVLLFILNILDGYNFTKDDIKTEQSETLTYHRIVEAFKFAYAKRTYLGDDAAQNLSEIVHNLTSRAYADSIRKLITDNATHSYEYYGPVYYTPDTHGTSHISILDQHGNSVAVTSTINYRFGSRLRGMRTGIIFNDEMGDFSAPNFTRSKNIPPTEANFIAPGKRPQSSMCPTIFINPDGSVRKVIGGSGGMRITTAVAWVASHNLWFSKDIREAIIERRLHHQLLPPYINFDPGFNMNIIENLQNLGHNVTQQSLDSSVVQGIDVSNGLIYAYSDFRKGGKPAGF